MTKVFISTSSFSAEALGLLKDRYTGEVLLNPFNRKVDSQELLKLAANADGIIAGTEIYDRGTLKKFSNLKIISRCGAGIDNIDLSAAEAFKIKVFNTPDAPTVAVAELTIGLAISLLRHIPYVDGNLRIGKWEKPMGCLLQGKTVGVVGLGRIGKKVVELLMPFAVKVLCYDIKPDIEFVKKYGINNTSLEDLLGKSDIITLHISSKGNQDYLIGEREIALMKDSAYLINTSRGDVLDEDALIEALEGNKISGAAFDVYKKEPYTGPLVNFKNVVLTAHIGSYAHEARIKMEKEAVENLIKGLKV